MPAAPILRAACVSAAIDIEAATRGMSSASLFQWGLSLNGGPCFQRGLSLIAWLGSIMMRGMVIDMNDRALQTLAQLRAFLDGTQAVRFSVVAKERYDFITRIVRRFGYAHLKRADKGVVLRFLARVSGYSRQQLTRLVQRVRPHAALLKRYCASRTSFARSFTDADVLLLAHTDSLHGTLSGPATKKLMERAWRVFADARYQRLATISVAHLYNLRKRSGYQRQRRVWTKTRPVPLRIGERRAPAPNNRPGYLRVDSVHQGDQDGVKGLYHINAVDCVTQYEGVATCERISEAFLIPVLEERCCKASRSASPCT